MKSSTRSPGWSLSLLLLVAACGSSGHPRGAGGDGGGGEDQGGSGGESTGGKGGSGQGGGGGPAISGGSGGAMAGTGGAPAMGGSGGVSDPGGSGGASEADDGGSPEPDAGVAMSDGSAPGGPTNYGGPGEHPSIPLEYTTAPVGPAVMAECPDDPTQGFTEYKDTFVIQRPYDLAAADRFSYQDGVYSFFVKSSDKAHQPGNGTAPRTEARYPNFSSGEHLWTADVLLDSPLSRTCIFQIHNVEASIAVYLRVVDGRLFNLSTGKTILASSYGKWFNLKVAFSTSTHEVRVFINNCLKETSKSPSGPTPNWYFKHGVYTCDSGTCRDHYKNIHLFQK
jgi:hypothetical protein